MKTFSVFFCFLLVAFLSLSVKAQWILQHAPGLPNSSQPQVIFSPVDDNVCWGKNSNNSQFLRTTDGGDNWSVSTVTGAAGLACSSIYAFDADTAWIAMNDPSGVTSGGIFKTTDGGNTWTQQSAFPGSGGHPNVIRFFNNANNGVCVGNPRNGEFEIFTTSNGGNIWNLVPGTNIPNPLAGELGIGNSNINRAVNNFWFPTLSNRLYKTTDQGYTWTVADSVTGGPSQIGFGFAFRDNQNGLAADFYPISVISKTTDGGETWVPINPYPSGLETISSLFIVYSGTNSSYVITSQTDLGGNQMLPGTAYSDDDGQTWTQVSNIPFGLAAFSDCNTGWAGGINDEIWKWDSDTLLCTTVVVEQENNSIIPDGFVLQQNYPNPFNPSTTIGYSIPTSEFVTLKVYDVLGNEVATLVNEEKPAGNYEVEFNNHSGSVRNLSSGVYLCTLQAGSFTQTKKLILMK